MSTVTPPTPSPLDDQAACIAADIAIARERNSLDYISARERRSLAQERQELAGITSNTGLWSAQRR
ncbi:hypothetical protein BN948_01795 [Hydrogenophaga intermedia]|uniref:Uncharacterized protein n=1 Tax=Hydrogenophaga intermedia TaxID=65786 RepID=A0A1L1PHA3_HYDIT|nr:hypothetical protein [Hydrogenophaga intermedia]CDN87373.1 hypothetical protein BN948_01795 [Hydrogenophaga intermedia]